MKQALSRKRNEDGFTLFELLIVIIILAILVGIVTFAVGSTRTNSLAASCASDAKSLGSALEEYKALVGSFPGAAVLQVTGPTNPTPAPLPSMGQTWGLRGFSSFQLPGTYGVLGNPVVSGGAWTAPNGQTVGAFMRQLPSTLHYQIATDGQGNVFIYPPGATINAQANGMDGQTPDGLTGDGDTNSLNFGTDPTICSDPNVVQ